VKENFKVTGFFYESHGMSFRKYLDVKRIGVLSESPDLVSVMMNPGSSKPVSGDFDGRCDAETIPDATQVQIMKLMDKSALNWVRIFNLSDLIEPKSTILLEKIQEMEKERIPHSIFTRKQDDIAEFIPYSIPVLFAWGVDKRLESLAIQACEQLSKHKIIGLQKEGFPYAYYHPLPQNWGKQLEWLEKISLNIKTWAQASSQASVS